MDRRHFLKGTALVGGCYISGLATLPSSSRIALVLDNNDPLSAAQPTRWALSELETALTKRGVGLEHVASLDTLSHNSFGIIVAGANTSTAQRLLHRANIKVPAGEEALVIAEIQMNRSSALLLCGSDVRGQVYAINELTDRVDCSSSTLDSLHFAKPLLEQPANAVRAVSRCFQSELEDKPWYNDHTFWSLYFSMLSAQRLNRFVLTFGLGYDFPRNISDCYFHFAYPFLVSVPGYNVRVEALPDGERENNLRMLRYISDQAALHTLDFQLGLWTHAYQWIDSPNANYIISGLTPDTHAPYCRDALRSLLEACPSINALAFRVHGESGVAEGNYDFWKTVFDGVKETQRRIEINLHAKGLDHRMIEVALATGMPVTISPKFCAEHMGLPYQQASIRDLERIPRAHDVSGLLSISSGSRQFLRYSYGDLLTRNRKYGVYSRVWPGTQRVLMWGDPAAAAAYSRAAQFCGECGADVFEPLSFKGRRGSGLPGGRCAYADTSLNPTYDWQKFSYQYRLWGRHLYNPATDPETWRRLLRKQFRAAANDVELALAHASRILPLVTTAHGPSADNHFYWPEMYVNMPIMDTGTRSIYGDTPSPKVFGNASPFDPVLFSSVDECATGLIEDKVSAKISCIQVAAWLEEQADAARRHLAAAQSKQDNPHDAEFRRVVVDVRIQIGLGEFFAAKFRAGILYSIFQRTNNRFALEESLKKYQEARTAWVDFAREAQYIYAADVTYGPEKYQRGHWLARVTDIDDDIAAMQDKLKQTKASQDLDDHRSRSVQQGIETALRRPKPLPISWQHTPPDHFVPGDAVRITLVASRGASESGLSASLRYRRVNQAEEYFTVEMEKKENFYEARIAPSYTHSGFPLQYFFEVHVSDGAGTLLPFFDLNAPQQPYYLVLPK